MPRALVRSPSPRLAEGLVTHMDRSRIDLDRPDAGHVVDLGGSRLLMSASAPRSASVVADLGYTPVVVYISEYEKLEGCVTCLSIRLRD